MRENTAKTTTTTAEELVRNTAVPAHTLPGGALGRLEAALDFKRGAEALANLYQATFSSPGADGDAAKFAGAAAPLIAEIAAKAEAAHNPLSPELLERVAAGKDDPAQFKQAALELAAHAATEAKGLDPKALVGAVRTELVETLGANRPLIEKPASQWQALGFTQDKALTYYRYLIQAVRASTDGFDPKYAPTDEARKTMERLHKISEFDIEEVTNFRTVAILLKELHKKAEAITASVPQEAKLEQARSLPEETRPGHEEPLHEEKAPVKREASPEILNLKETIGSEIKGAVDALQAVSFEHEEQCAEILGRGAEALMKLEELAVLVESGPAPKTFEEARRSRSDVAVLAESATAEAEACAEAAARYFGAEADGISDAARKLTAKVAELASGYDDTLKRQLESELVKSLGAGSAKIVIDPGTPTEEAQERRGAAKTDLRDALVALNGPAEVLARETLAGVDELIDGYKSIAAKIRTLGSAADRVAVSTLMSDVAEAVDAFEDRKAELEEKIGESYGAPDQEAGRAELRAALDELAQAVEADNESFFQRAQLRFRSVGRANKAVAEEAAGDAAEVDALASAVRGKAAEAVALMSAPHAERSATVVKQAWDVVNDATTLSGLGASSEDESLDRSVARHAAVSASANDITERVRSGIEELEKSFSSEAYAEAATKVKGVLESAGKLAADTAEETATNLRDALWREISAPIARESLSALPAPLAQAVIAWNRGRASTDPDYVKVEVVPGEDDSRTIALTKPNSKSGQWVEALVKGNKLQLGAANVPSVGKAQIGFELANENEAARYAAAFLSDKTPRGSASLNVAGSPLVMRMLADPEARCVTIQNAHVKSESWREVLPKLSGATLSAVVLEDIDAKGARVTDLKLKNVTVKRLDNLFGEMSIECLGRCDLSDKSNRWGNLLQADLGAAGMIAGNAQHTKLELKGLVMEYAKRAAELRAELAEANKEIAEIDAKLQIKERGEKGMFSHVRENGGLLSFSGWRNGIKAWRGAKAENAALGMDEAAHEAALKRKAELEEQVKGMNAELAKSNKEVRARAGNLVLTVKKSDQELRPQAAELTNEERRALSAQRGNFAELADVLKARMNASASLSTSDGTLRLSKGGYTIVLDRFTNRAGDDTGYATLQIVRADGSRAPINIGGDAREMIKLRYATALRTAQGLLSASPDKVDEVIRKLYFARSKERETRRIPTNDEVA